MTLIYKKMLPAEIIFLGAFFFALILQQFWGYKFIVPSAESGGWLELIEKGAVNYLKIFSLAFIAFALSLIYFRIRGNGDVSKKELLGKLFLFLRLFACYIGCVYFMLLFKWWSVLNPLLWDELYEETDTSLSEIMPLVSTVSRYLGIGQTNYFSVFALFFVAAYLQTAIFHREFFERVVTVGLCIMVMGGAAYMLFPAYGPLVFGVSTDSVIGHAQNVMLDASNGYRNSKGELFKVSYYEAVLGAMPSLHVAHTVAIAVYMLAINRVIALPYILGAVFIAVYSVETRFHYVIDIFAGLAIAGIAVIITEFLFRQRNK